MEHDPKWKSFERLVTAIHYAVEQGGQVTWNDKINGRQFDVTIRFERGFYTYLTVIECKDYTDSVPVKEVEAFVIKAIDAKANKAIMATSSRFQSGCFDVAKRHNIDLFTLKQINKLPKEFIGEQLSPAFNIFDIRLLNSKYHTEYVFPKYGGKLYYLMIHTKINIDSNLFSLDKIISDWIQGQKAEVNDEPKSFYINFNKAINAHIPQEESPFIFDKINFKCKFYKVIIAKEPTLDPHLLQKINTSFRYKDEILEVSHEISSQDLALGFDTKFEHGKFYYNPILEFFYYCDSIEDGTVKMYLIESYQHGQLVQAQFTFSTKFSNRYIEVTNEKEIERLEKLLNRMKNRKK